MCRSSALDGPASARRCRWSSFDAWKARNSSGAYAQLAILAYQSGQTRTGDLARRKALELTDPDMRESLRGQLDAAKQSAAGAAGGGGG